MIAISIQQQGCDLSKVGPEVFKKLMGKLGELSSKMQGGAQGQDLQNLIKKFMGSLGGQGNFGGQGTQMGGPKFSGSFDGQKMSGNVEG